MSWRAVLKAIYFDVQFGFVAEEVQNVRANRVLATEFVVRKAMGAQP